ncbi:hypothetical protein N7492_000674 [Penicillium capsulatum]|uniref:Uncharacterized protein n=1 Tax=Penicillium capsulatum TaxID=69766 RepID=A0A9W9IQ06_9EURO|nr:hypothetical protein N7492_000674 [Penicillium capsulatum]KAJ6130267.1 hypothetical protein N7512_003047 [Penicillium capsulatum]
MVLLTSSTVSAILSMGVICLFTILLFLSGYVLQQQSVKNIQHALRPPTEGGFAKGHPVVGSTLQKKRGVTDQDLGLSADQRILQGSDDRHDSSKGNYAYLQLLSHPDPSDICSAVLFFKQLSMNGTGVQDRLFMYPDEWDRMSPAKIGKSTATALSILRKASREYGIWLLPIDMTAATSRGHSPNDVSLLRLGQIQFMQYDSVLYVRTPGIILDTERLDRLLLSRPLPLRYDKNRRESYNNEAWIPVPLRPERDTDLPPVYLITTNNIGAGNIETRTHIPNLALPGFGGLVVNPKNLNPQTDENYESPGYVYFENDRDGRVKWEKNPLFGTWRYQQSEVCDGLEFDDFDPNEQ